jgi:hypothetical protein
MAFRVRDAFRSVPPRISHELYTIADARNATRLGTMRAAEEPTTCFDSVADDLAITMGARGGECMNGTLETVEGV